MFSDCIPICKTYNCLEEIVFQPVNDIKLSAGTFDISVSKNLLHFLGFE